jgi:hypothetical protein
MHLVARTHIACIHQRNHLGSNEDTRRAAREKEPARAEDDDGDALPVHVLPLFNTLAARRNHRPPN